MKDRHTPYTALLLFFGAALVFSLPVQAKTAEDSVCPQLCQESLGTLSSFQDGGLGRDVWDGGRRRFIADSLEAIDTLPANRHTVPYLRRLLLSATNPALIRNNVRPDEENNLLDLRLQALVRMGFYDDAADLYALIPDGPQTAGQLRAGITALFGRGDVALACLEFEALAPGFLEDKRYRRDADDLQAFFGDVSFYCGQTFKPLQADGKAAGNDKAAAYLEDPEKRLVLTGKTDLSVLPPLLQAYLFGTGRVALSPDVSWKDLPATAALLQLYRAAPAADPGKMDVDADARRARLTLTTALVSYGLLSVDDLKDAYAAAALPASATDDPDKVPDRMRLPALYQALSDVPYGAPQTKNVLTAIKAERDLVPLLPFADVAAHLPPPEDQDPETVFALLRLISASDVPLSPAWNKTIQDLFTQLFTESSNASEVTEEDLVSLYLAASLRKIAAAPDQKKEMFQFIKSRSYSAPALAVLSSYVFSKNLKDNYYSLYEKLIDLTRDDNYVMPLHVSIDSFEKMRSNLSIGEVILTIAHVFRDGGMSGSSHRVLYEAFLTLNTVGLDELSVALGRDVLTAHE